MKRKFWSQQLVQQQLRPSPSDSNLVIVSPSQVSRGKVLASAAGLGTVKPPGRGGHKHNPSSRWSQKHNLYRRYRDEMRDVFDSSRLDREKGETIAMLDSVLLDVEKGEILRQGIRYQRRFDVFNR